VSTSLDVYCGLDVVSSVTAELATQQLQEAAFVMNLDTLQSFIRSLVPVELWAMVPKLHHSITTLPQHKSTKCMRCHYARHEALQPKNWE